MGILSSYSSKRGIPRLNKVFSNASQQDSKADSNTLKLKKYLTFNLLLSGLLITITNTGWCNSSKALIKHTGLKQFSIEQGLSQNTIQDIFQDNNGIVWLATNNGLNKLDGVNTEYFHGPNSVLTGQAINVVKEDSSANLWIATDETLYQIDKQRISSEAYRFPNYIKTDNTQNYVVDLIEKSVNQYWIITYKGIFILQSEGKEILPVDSMVLLAREKANITSVINTELEIWLATTKGLYRFNKKSYQIKRFVLPSPLNAAHILSMQLIDSYRLFITANSGAVEINTQLSSAIDNPLISTNRVKASVTLKNIVFYAVDDQIHAYDVKTHTSQHLFTLSEVLPRYTNFTIRNLYIDQGNRLWIGTKNQGAYVWETNTLDFHTLSNIATDNSKFKLSNNRIWNFSEDKNENLWVATDNGLNYLNLTNKTITTYLTHLTESNQYKTSKIFCLLPVNETLWLGTADGLIAFNTKSREYEVFNPDFIDADGELRIHSITSTPDGSIWMATNLGALKFNPETKVFRQNKTLRPSEASPEATFIRFDHQKLWIGYRNQLDTYDPFQKKRKTIFKVLHSTTNTPSLTDIHIDKNHLWIAFNGRGIYVIDMLLSKNNIIKQFNHSNGFIDNTVHSLLPDKNSLWASTHSGLVKFNKRDFTYLTYDYFNGLPTNEFNEGASFRTSKGKLLFGGANGILVITPDSLKEPDINTSPMITEIGTQEKKYALNGIKWENRNIQFSESDSLLLVHLSILDFISPHKWHFEYWLSGRKQTQPIEISKNEFSISNLKPGSYQLNIRAKIPGYKKFSKITTFPFKVTGEHWALFEIKSLAYLAIIFTIMIFLYRKIIANRLLTQQISGLQKKAAKLNLTILTPLKGIWEWRSNELNIDESELTIFLEYGETIQLTITQYFNSIHLDDLEQVKQKWQSFLNRNTSVISCNFRYFYINKWIHCQIYGKINEFDKNGNILQAGGNWTNTTLNSIKKEKLNLFKSAFQSTRDIIFILNKDLDIISVNKAYKRQTGFSSQYLIGKNIVEIAETRLAYKVSDELITQIKENKSWQGEASMPRKNSSSYPIDIRIDAIKHEKNKSNYVVIMSELSSQIRNNSETSTGSYYDILTGLPGLALAKDRLSHATAIARLQNRDLILVHIDLEKFKFYTQTLGKGGAREIVVNSSNRILALLNKQDTLARVSTHEFYIIFENVEHIETVSFKLESILKQLSTPQIIANSNVKITASAGISCFPLDASTSKELRQTAQKALAQAQQSGPGKINYFNKEVNTRAADRLNMKAALHSAIQNNQFFIVFQPRYHLASNQIAGFELLLRWRTQEGNIIYPSQFIRIAEETGLMEMTTHWLIEESLKVQARWKKEGINTIFALNLTPEYCNKDNTADYLVDKLSENGLSPMNLQIEISEKEYSKDINNNLKFVANLRQKGFDITLDDYGSGSTPLNYLKNIPVHSFKLDRNFVRNIGKDKNNDHLVCSIISMINGLRLSCTAKGIENKEQLNFLINAGCEYGQGYYFSDPLSEPGAKDFIKKYMTEDALKH